MSNFLNSYRLADGVGASFIVEITVLSSDSVTLPFTISGTYSGTVNWNEGGGDEVITAYNDPAASHTYTTGGTYEVEMNGTFSLFNTFTAGNLQNYIVDIIQWGSVGLTDLSFRGCTGLNSALTPSDTPDLSLMTSLLNLFYDCPIITITNLDSWDVSYINDMQAVFWNTDFDQAIPSWDVSNVTTFSNMFYNSDFNQSLNTWDFSSALSLRQMLRQCLYNQSINWTTTGLVTDMYYFLQNSDSFNQTIYLDTSSVTDMGGMVRSMGLFDQDISAWDFTTVTSMTEFNKFGVMTTTNYDLFLIALDAHGSLQSGVNCWFNCKYSAGAAATARANVISNYSWVFTDLGQV